MDDLLNFLAAPSQSGATQKNTPTHAREGTAFAELFAEMALPIGPDDVSIEFEDEISGVQGEVTDPVSQVESDSNGLSGNFVGPEEDGQLSIDSTIDLAVMPQNTDTEVAAAAVAPESLQIIGDADFIAQPIGLGASDHTVKEWSSVGTSAAIPGGSLPARQAQTNFSAAQVPTHSERHEHTPSIGAPEPWADPDLLAGRSGAQQGTAGRVPFAGENAGPPMVVGQTTPLPEAEVPPQSVPSTQAQQAFPPAQTPETTSPSTPETHDVPVETTATRPGDGSIPVHSRQTSADLRVGQPFSNAGTPTHLPQPRGQASTNAIPQALMQETTTAAMEAQFQGRADLALLAAGRTNEADSLPSVPAATSAPKLGLEAKHASATHSGPPEETTRSNASDMRLRDVLAPGQPQEQPSDLNLTGKLAEQTTSASNPSALAVTETAQFTQQVVAGLQGEQNESVSSIAEQEVQKELLRDLPEDIEGPRNTFPERQHTKEVSPPVAHVAPSAAATFSESFGNKSMPALEFDLLPHGALVTDLSLSHPVTGTAQAPSAAVPSSHAQPVSQQIAAALSDPSRDPNSPLDIALDPPELGKVRMSVSETNGTLAVTIMADRPETADLMRRHLTLLEQEFARAGLDAPSVHISNGDRGEPADQGQESETSDPQTPSSSEPSETSIGMTQAARAAGSGLDIRL